MKVLSYTNNLFLFLFLQLTLCFSLFACLQVPQEQQQTGFCSDQDLNTMATLGALKDSSPSSQNSLELDSLARFAVDEHNKKEVLLVDVCSIFIIMCFGFIVLVIVCGL